MQSSPLPDKIVRRIRIPILGYNTLKFVIYIAVGIPVAFAAYLATRNAGVFMLAVAVFFFAAFFFSIVRINGEIDLDTYIRSLLTKRERATTGHATGKLVNIDGLSGKMDMLKFRGSYMAVMEVTGDTVAVMSDDKAKWYFDGFTQYLTQVSPKVVCSFITLPSRYDPSRLAAQLKPRAGVYFTDLAQEYRDYMASFRAIRVYTGIVVLRLNPATLLRGRDTRGVDMEQTARREFEFEVEKVARNLGSRGISVRMIVGDELFGLGKLLYEGGL